jgi:hypothetical protein
MGFHAVIQMSEIFEGVVGGTNGSIAQQPEKGSLLGVLFYDGRNNGGLHLSGFCSWIPAFAGMTVWEL